MLIELSIQNFAIIDDLHLEFGQGLSVISGETGAGKSITVDALAYILGGKADISAISHNQAQCNLIATFDIEHIPQVRDWLNEQSIEHEDNLCIIRRVITREGRSKNFINGQAMPLHAVKTLGEWLVDIHGQHAHQTLVKESYQRALIDQYAETEEEIRQLSQYAKEIRTLNSQLSTLSTEDASSRERAEFLKFQLQEFVTIKPSIQEWENLVKRHAYLSSFEERLMHTQECYALLENDQHGINRQLRRLQAGLAQLVKKDPQFSDLGEMVNNAAILCAEVENDLSRMSDNDELDPTELQNTEARMRLLNDLARKHRIDPEMLLEKQTSIEEELARYCPSEEQIQTIERALATLKSDWQQVAAQVTKKRVAAIKLLQKQITEAMQTLAMTGGVFDVTLHPLDDYGPFGHELIEFMVSANPGMPLKSLAKVASGGELARISLCISVILSMKSSLPTLIFDEVDSGVGGAVAEMIGKHLQKLSSGRQVFCVTHLPQVASFAHSHFLVAKTKGVNKTETEIKKLTKEERIQEIARMLGGIKLTEATYQHAEEMLCSNSQT